MHVGGTGGGGAMHVGGIGGGRVGSPGDHDRYHGYGRGVGFAAGLAAGSALGYGYDEYSDDADSSSCAQRYQSYDPASGTYLGDDGLRHPCP
jgi:hypothetical protein